FSANQIIPGISSRIGSDPTGKTTKNVGGNHPPKNKIEQIPLIRIMFAYSPRKNKANVMEEYSTLNPATSSASASGKSNGWRLVSANMQIKNTITMGK